MDYRINNEAIISCVIVKILEQTSCDTLRISLIVPLLMEKLAVRDADLTVRYKDYLPLVINSISLLMQKKCVQLNNDELLLTKVGLELCENIDAEKMSNRLCSIIERINGLLEDIRDYPTQDLYKQLKIIL